MNGASRSRFKEVLTVYKDSDDEPETYVISLYNKTREMAGVVRALLRNSLEASHYTVETHIFVNGAFQPCQQGKYILQETAREAKVTYRRRQHNSHYRVEVSIQDDLGKEVELTFLFYTALDVNTFRLYMEYCLGTRLLKMEAFSRPMIRQDWEPYEYRTFRTGQEDE